jgi:hypothetical protein
MNEETLVGLPYTFSLQILFEDGIVTASITAHAARPILSLLDVVRFKGEQHAELEAFDRGEEFEFEEPDWELARE